MGFERVSKVSIRCTFLGGGLRVKEPNVGERKI